MIRDIPTYTNATITIDGKPIVATEVGWAHDDTDASTWYVKACGCKSLEAPLELICRQCGRAWPCPDDIRLLAEAAATTVATEWQDSIEVLADVMLERGLMKPPSKARRERHYRHRTPKSRLLSYTFKWARAACGFKANTLDAQEIELERIRRGLIERFIDRYPDEP